MPQWITVAKSADLPPGQRQCVDVQGLRLALFNQKDELLAIEDVCPHAGLPLADGALTGTIIICPYHGYCFDIRTGRNIDYADDPAVRTFPVRVEGDDIQVDLDAP